MHSMSVNCKDVNFTNPLGPVDGAIGWLMTCCLCAHLIIPSLLCLLFSLAKQLLWVDLHSLLLNRLLSLLLCDSRLLGVSIVPNET